MATFNSPSDSSFKPKDMELIFSTTLTSATNSVTTGTLPTGFKSYLINVRGRTDRANFHTSFANIYFNGDTNDSSYQVIKFNNRNTFPLAGASGDQPAGLLVPSAGGDADFYGGASIRVYSPESTTGFKSFTTSTGSHSDDDSSVADTRRQLDMRGVWKNTLAITSITFQVISTQADGSQADWEVGSSFEVYGLK